MNSIQMEVVIDKVVVFCTQDKQRFGTEQNKRKDTQGALSFIL